MKNEDIVLAIQGKIIKSVDDIITYFDYTEFIESIFEGTLECWFGNLSDETTSESIAKIRVSFNSRYKSVNKLSSATETEILSSLNVAFVKYPKLQSRILKIAKQRDIEIDARPSSCELININDQPINTSSKIISIEKLSRVDFDINPVQYSLKRDELIMLIDDILGIEGISSKRVNEFEVIRKRCLENQFNIVLLGEYQGGKSTVFNAICDGREISPRGAMIKTSACKITATNLSDEKDKEYALVKWKTSSELLQGMDKILTNYIFKNDIINENGRENISLYESLDLNIPANLQLAKTAVEQEWNEISTITGNPDSKEICKIALIIVTFYSSEVVKEAMSKDSLSIAEVSKLAVFPDDWNTKWLEGVNAFKPQEVLFAFVSSINCFIHSNNLRRLGCSITDCPGLFTSAWDTSVALNTLPNANAIIYLLSGEKQMGEGDVHTLSYINSHFDLVKDKMFFAINMKKKPILTDNILAQDRAILNCNGFQGAFIHKFNSLLFLLGENANSYLCGTIDEFSNDRFIDLSNRCGIEGTDFSTCWINNVSDISRIASDIRDVETLDENSGHLVLLSSNKAEIFSKVEQFIIDLKAYSILIEQGAGKIQQSLEELESELITQENDANKSVEECEAEYKKREALFSDFKKGVNVILNDSFPQSMTDMLMINSYDSIIRNEQAIKKIALQMAVKIPPLINLACKKDAILKSIFSKLKRIGGRFEDLSTNEQKHVEKIKERLEPAINSVIEDNLKDSITNWSYKIFQGKDNHYKGIILPELERVSEAINEKWKDSLKKDAYLEAYKISSPNIDVSEIIEKNNTFQVIDGNTLSDGVFQATLSNVVSEIVKVIISLIVGVIVGVVYDLMLTGGIGSIFMLIYAAIGTISARVVQRIGKETDTRDSVDNESQLDKVETKIYQKVYTMITTEFNKEETKEKLLLCLVKVPNKAIDTYKQYYRDQLKTQEDKLSDDINDSKLRKQKSIKDQQAIANNAKEKRENVITPMVKKLSEFIVSCGK